MPAPLINLGYNSWNQKKRKPINPIAGGGFHAPMPTQRTTASVAAPPTAQELAQKAVEEAKTKTEASKEAGLGYYGDLSGMREQLQQKLSTGTEASLGYLKPLQEQFAQMGQGQGYQRGLGYFEPIQKALAGMQPELISEGQQAGMLGKRRAELAAYGQNLGGLYTDPYSGVQSGQRRSIGLGIAGRQANLPIELQLEVAGKNREAMLGLYGQQAGVAGQMAGLEIGREGQAMQGLLGQTDIASQMAGIERQRMQDAINLYGSDIGIAGAKAGIEQAYEYDPGLGYLQQLGFGEGYGSPVAPPAPPQQVMGPSGTPLIGPQRLGTGRMRRLLGAGTF